MSWWNKTKKIWLAILGVGLLLIGISWMVFRPARPIGAAKMCTLLGCLSTIEVDVKGLPDSTSYEVEIQNLQDQNQTLTCVTGQEKPYFLEAHTCIAAGAIFVFDPDDVPPEEITVTVTADGKTVSQEFRPTYKKFQPNGEDCPPVCYSSTIVMDVSQ